MQTSMLAFVFLLTVLVVELISEGTASITPTTFGSSQQQKQNVYEYTYSGKSVRYETQPMHYVDAKNSRITASQARASTDFCVDIEGKRQPNGAEYQRSNKHFFYRCTAGNEEVTACVGTERTKQARIPVGETLTVDEFWHKCELMANGSVVYTQSNSCQYAGNEYSPNTEFMMGPIKMMCTEEGANVLGCVYEANGEKISLTPGENKEFKNAKYFCQTQQNMIVPNTAQNTQQTILTDNIQSQTQLQSTQESQQKQSKQQPRTSCAKNGRSYANGEQFQSNHIRFECQNGNLQIIGCYNGLGEAMNIAQDIVGKNNMVYRCYKTSPQVVEYEEHSCGYRNGPPCSPPSAIDQQRSQSSRKESAHPRSGEQQKQATQPTEKQQPENEEANNDSDKENGEEQPKQNSEMSSSAQQTNANAQDAEARKQDGQPERQQPRPSHSSQEPPAKTKQSNPDNSVNTH